MGPFMVTRCMSSTVSACLATPFRIKGINYSITSACSTIGALHRQRRRADPVGQAGHRLRRRRRGARLDALLPLRRDGGDELEVQRRARDGRRALRRRPATASSSPAAAASSCSRSSSTPGRAARRSTPRSPATAPPPTATTWSPRAARAASGRCGSRSRRMPGNRKVGYINAHGTSTPVGDVTEVEAIRRVFGEGHMPPIRSTKSLTGHSQGATGVHEAIYCLLMLQRRLHRRLGQRRRRSTRR